MLSHKKVEEIIGVVLLIGILVSAFLVLMGGVLFLWQNGQDTIQTLPIIHQTTLSGVWQFAFSFSALSIIELGLLTLVTVQILRVALLCGFYLMIRDYWFILISTFILAMLIYSTIWRN